MSATAVKALFLLSFFGTLGCNESAPPVKKLDLTRTLLELADSARKDLAPELPRSSTIEQRLGSIVDRVRTRKKGRSNAARVIGQVLFDELGFEDNHGLANLDGMLLTRVVARRRGSCIGLAGLYLVIAEQLGLDLHGVLVPGHLFVHQRVPPQNIELLGRGAHHPQSWYRARYRVPPANNTYLRDLGTPEVIAVFRYNLGNEYRKRGRYRGAAALYRRSLAALPSFAEAHANLGLTLHRLGDRAGARRSYNRALKEHPGMPEARNNLAALEWEARRRSATGGRRPPR